MHLRRNGNHLAAKGSPQPKWLLINEGKNAFRDLGFKEIVILSQIMRDLFPQGLKGSGGLHTINQLQGEDLIGIKMHLEKGDSFRISVHQCGKPLQPLLSALGRLILRFGELNKSL
jgi:hypothetical protein